MSRTGIDPDRKTVRVGLKQADAFEVFTADISRWWSDTGGPVGPPTEIMVFEPRLGGRWGPVSPDGHTEYFGNVRIWEPPYRFVASWNFVVHRDPIRTADTEVEARFDLDGPDATVVQFEHRGFERFLEEAEQNRELFDRVYWPNVIGLFLKGVEFHKANL